MRSEIGKVLGNDVVPNVTCGSLAGSISFLSRRYFI